MSPPEKRQNPPPRTKRPMIADVNTADFSESPTTNRKLRQIPRLLEVSMCVPGLVAGGISSGSLRWAKCRASAQHTGRENSLNELGINTEHVQRAAFIAIPH